MNIESKPILIKVSRQRSIKRKASFKKKESADDSDTSTIQTEYTQRSPQKSKFAISSGFFFQRTRSIVRRTRSIIRKTKNMIRFNILPTNVSTKKNSVTDLTIKPKDPPQANIKSSRILERSPSNISSTAFNGLFSSFGQSCEKSELLAPKSLSHSFSWYDSHSTQLFPFGSTGDESATLQAAYISNKFPYQSSNTSVSNPNAALNVIIQCNSVDEDEEFCEMNKIRSFHPVVMNAFRLHTSQRDSLVIKHLTGVKTSRYLKVFEIKQNQHEKKVTVQQSDQLSEGMSGLIIQD